MQTNEKLCNNIMIIGKTGAGKSSLLNYFAGWEKAKTGDGEPMTKKGEFTEHSYNSTLNFIDSWGLEIKKQKEWTEEIIKEINRRIETPTITDDISCLLYVVNSGTDRFEKTEEKNY